MKNSEIFIKDWDFECASLFNVSFLDLGLERVEGFTFRFNVVDEHKFFLAVVKYSIEYELR